MRFNGVIVAFFVLMIVQSANSQQFKLGKVTVAELEEKSHPKDSSAAAALLFKNTNVYFELSSEGFWKLVTESSIKIKIYKKDGYNYANYAEDYYMGGKREEVFYYDCVTYNLVNGKIEKTKLGKEGEFIEKKNKYFNVKKISMPNVKEGSVIEFRTVKYSYGIAKPDDFYMQYEIPANHIRYSVVIPEFFSFNKTLGGFLQPKIEEKREYNPNYHFSENRMVFSLSDVPPLKNEAYVNNIDNYRSRILYELSAHIDQKGQITKFATNWAAVAKQIYDDDEFGAQLKRDDYFKADIDKVLTGLTLRDEKIDAIFKYVQSHMNWNSYSGYYTDLGVKEAYKSKIGNAADINLMLTSMLRYANLNANPVLISTRDNGIHIFPSRTAYNYVISAVEVGDSFILLDATSKNSRPNIVPFRALNWFGRMIKKDGTSVEVDLMPKESSRDIVSVMATINADGKVSGNARQQFTDYNAYLIRENLINLSKESYMEFLEKLYPGTFIDDMQLSNQTDLEKPVAQQYTFTHENSVEVIGDRLYVSPLLHLTEKENPFKQDTRSFPVDFRFPKMDKYAISLVIPDGYEIESLPEARVFKMGDALGVFKYNITAAGNQIQLVVQHEMNTAIVDSDHYDTLKAFYHEMIMKQKEKVVLKKI